MEGWNNITLNLRGESVEIDGVGFSSIGRLELLTILQQRLRAVGVHANPFEDQGLELLIQAASGLPRAINHLAQRAIEAAAATATPTISATHVQAALDRLPWLGSSVA